MGFKRLTYKDIIFSFETEITVEAPAEVKDELYRKYLDVFKIKVEAEKASQITEDIKKNFLDVESKETRYLVINKNEGGETLFSSNSS